MLRFLTSPVLFIVVCVVLFISVYYAPLGLLNPPTLEPKHSIRYCYRLLLETGETRIVCLDTKPLDFVFMMRLFAQLPREVYVQ